MTSQGAPEAGAYWKHLKSGHLVRVLGIGKMQSANWRELIGEQDLPDGCEVGTSVDMREVVIYEHDGNLWARPRGEFEDGRFALATSPSPPPGVGEAISVQDPMMILAGIKQFGFAADGSDLRDLAAAIERLAAPPVGVEVVKLAAVETGEALDRLREIAYRDSAVSVTVQAADLRAFLEETQRYVIRTCKRDLVLKEAEEGLKRLARAYVGLLESGRDRIISFGGNCDPVDVMEAGDPALCDAKATLARLGAAP